MSAALRGLALGIVLAVVLASCVVKRIMTPRLTGTCAGACAHYVECKTGATREDRVRCDAECPQVFSDPDSLMAFESLSCPDAVEYVDGKTPQAAGATNR